MVEPHDTRRIQLWRDWLLVAVGLAALGALLDLVADAAYHGDGTVLYWLLIAYSYPDGTPPATLVGLAVVGLAPLAFWISLRLLSRAGYSSRRALAVFAVTALTGVSAECALLLAPLVSDGVAPFPGALPLGFGLLTAALVLGLLALLGIWPGRGGARRRASPPREARTRRGLTLAPLALILLATLLATTVGPIALLIGERPTNYIHLASATFASRRYYLALEQPPSEASSVVLYRCGALGVWCRAVDALAVGSSERQSAGGRLRYDPAARTLTVSEGQHVLLTYPAADLFEGP